MKDCIKKAIACFLLFAWMLLGGSDPTLAGSLNDRLASFPQWKSKPALEVAEGGDLIYPQWMAGTWQVTSTLVDLVAPLAPKMITPGFEGNRQYLNQPIQFQVRFSPRDRVRNLNSLNLSFPVGMSMRSLSGDEIPIVADREFNGTNIAKAYLGGRSGLAVKVDPQNPNRQITFLGSDRQLVSIVTSRGQETPTPHRLIATEVAQQFFQSEVQIYLNEVETTTAYQLLPTGRIEADQITAIYLSPQDPDYFKAAGQPVALYRYHLELALIENSSI